MAKRPSARRTSNDDDVDEGDDDSFAWETPKKGKKETGKVKSATGRKSKRPSAEEEVPEERVKSGSARKKLGKSSGSNRVSKSGKNGLEGSSRSKRSGSARRPSNGDDEDEGETSGRRRRAAPPRKKSNSAVLLISIGTLTVLLIGGIVLINKGRTPAPQVRHDTELEQIIAGGKDGTKDYRAWNQAKNSGAGNEQQLYHSAKNKLQTAVEKLQALLDQPPYVDQNGDRKKEYEGYEQYLQEWATLLVDLEKGSTLGNG